jgi:hypothetical protein
MKGMTLNEPRRLEEMAAALATFRAEASHADEPSQKIAHATENASVESGPVESAAAVLTADEAAHENKPTITTGVPSPLATLDGLETAIRLRWVLRDIKVKRTKLSPANPDDLEMLVKMALVEIRDNVPVLTSEGHWAID